MWDGRGGGSHADRSCFGVCIPHLGVLSTPSLSVRTLLRVRPWGLKQRAGQCCTTGQLEPLGFALLVRINNPSILEGWPDGFSRPPDLPRPSILHLSYPLSWKSRSRDSEDPIGGRVAGSRPSPAQLRWSWLSLCINSPLWPHRLP